MPRTFNECPKEARKLITVLMGLEEIQTRTPLLSSLKYHGENLAILGIVYAKAGLTWVLKINMAVLLSSAIVLRALGSETR